MPAKTTHSPARSAVWSHLHAQALHAPHIVLQGRHTGIQHHSCRLCLHTDTPLMQAYVTLADRLPYAKHMHSKILCGVTKAVMDEDNVPMVMPNGTVYSEAAVRRLSSDTGMFTCPNSGTPQCSTSSCNQGGVGPLAQAHALLIPMQNRRQAVCVSNCGPGPAFTMTTTWYVWHGCTGTDAACTQASSVTLEPFSEPTFCSPLCCPVEPALAVSSGVFPGCCTLALFLTPDCISAMATLVPARLACMWEWHATLYTRTQRPALPKGMQFMACICAAP